MLRALTGTRWHPPTAEAGVHHPPIWRAPFLLAATLLGTVAAPALAGAQEVGRISGRVSDAETGAPLSDVQVYLVDANLGAITRQNGTYLVLNVPAGTYQIRAERIGLESGTQQITVTAGGTLTIDFALTEQALGLDEIVVTGTAGAARRREVGNSITQINAVDLPDRPTSVTDMLTSMAPGVEINRAGGGETGQGSEIVIRGINSINNNTQPIIFIDGVRMMSSLMERTAGVDNRLRSAFNEPGALDQLNPNDIERIEIISGPAASTLYGTEASAGVIQVFTRRGQNRAPSWTVESQVGTLWTPAYGANGITHLWMDPWICTGPFSCGQYQDVPIEQMHTASVRGGGQSLQYFVSGGHDREEGSTPNDNLERWTIRGNFTLNPLEDVVLQWNSAYTATHQQNTATGNNAGGLTLNVVRQERNYFGTADPEILNQALDWDITQGIERLTTGGTVTYQPTTNLTNRLTIGYDFTQQETRNLRPFGYFNWPQGGLDVQVYSRRYLSFDYVGSLNFTLMNGLLSTLSWGGQATGDFSSRVRSWGEGFPGAAFPTVNSASSTLGFEEREKTWNSGFFFQNVFSLRDKYYVTLGMRVDGNSTFGKGFGLAMYPKASASWVVSDESFWNEGLGELKLRAAWGKSGRAPGTFIAQRTWQNTGLDGKPAFTPDNLGNPDIGPEVTSEIELGFDASWLGDRVRPRYTYYHQTTTDAIQELDPIPSLGFTSEVAFNIGEVENWGHEFSLDVTAVQKRNWGLDIGTNLSSNGNEVVKWLGEDDPASSNRIGRPISYSTWDLYHNPEGMGTSFHSGTRTFTTQSCLVDAEDENGNDILDENGDNVEVWRPGLDPSIHGCHYDSENVYGYPMSRPTIVLGTNATLRMPAGMTLSVRADYRGGHGYWRQTNAMGSAIGRQARSPLCIPYYVYDDDNLLKPDTPAVWVRRCRNGTGSSYRHPGETLRLHSIAATLPMDFAFPDQVQNATLTLVLNNAFSWGHGMFGAYGINQGGSTEQLPASTSIRASLRVTF